MEEIYRKNESETNEMCARAVKYLLVFLGMIAVLCRIGVFDISFPVIMGFCLFSLPPLLFPIILVDVLHISRTWVKYVIIGCVVLVVGAAYAVFTFQAILLFFIPSILATMYLDKKVSVLTAVFTCIGILAAHVSTGFFLFQPHIEPFTDMKMILLYGAFPRILQYLCGAVLLYLISARMTAFMQGVKDVERQVRREETLPDLTEREREVFELMLKGDTNGQIADKLCLSMGTVKNYVSVIYDKAGTNNRTALILKYGSFLR